MKILILTLPAFLIALVSFSQQDPSQSNKATVKWAPAGLYFGNVSIQGEYRLNSRNSATFKTGIPIAKGYQVRYEGKDASYEVEAMAFQAGYRHYLSKKKVLKGFYIEPFAKYLQHQSDGSGSATLDARDVQMNFTNKYSGLGVGAQLGVQFLIRKRVVVDLFFLGPEINTSKNQFKATEVSNSLSWTSVEAEDAEREIRDFLNGFPFIRNKNTVSVDQENKTVTAGFKGWLPGIRTGVSFGIAF